MLTELLKSANGKLKSYLGLTFFISWVIHNRNIVVALFSMDNLNFSQRISLLESQLPDCWLSWTWHMFLVPLLLATTVSLLFIVFQSLIKAFTEYGDGDVRGKVYGLLPWAQAPSPQKVKDFRRTISELSNENDKLSVLVEELKPFKKKEQAALAKSTELELKNNKLSELQKSDESKYLKLFNDFNQLQSSNLPNLLSNVISGEFLLYRDHKKWLNSLPSSAEDILSRYQGVNFQKDRFEKLKIENNTLIINGKSEFYCIGFGNDTNKINGETTLFMLPISSKKNANGKGDEMFTYKLRLVQNREEQDIFFGYQEHLNRESGSTIGQLQEWLLVKK